MIKETNLLHWLLIGGEGHGQTFLISDDSRLTFPCKNSFESQLYEGKNYLNNSQLFRVGIHNATTEQMSLIPRLITKTKLTALPLVHS